MGLLGQRTKASSPQDFTEAATALFERFAAHNGLRHVVRPDAPVDVLWEFPAQENLIHPMILGLQNGDELNFGVGEFWSYFFPYPEVASEFEELLAAWIEGRARVASFNRQRGFALQILRDGQWQTRYRANRIRAFRGEPVSIISNRTL